MGAETYKSTLSIKVSSPSRNYEKTISYETDGAPQEIEVDVPDSTTDMEVTVAIDYSKLKCLLLIATVAMTIETNNGTTPDDTITLGGANELFRLWTEDDPDACPLTVDVTKIFVTNSSGNAGVLTLFAAQDVTP